MTRPRIAVIEDNPDNRLLLQALLEERYDLAEYSDGPSGLAGLRAQAADLLLLDVSLPEMDGLSVLAALRSDPALAALPVVALTAHAMQGDRERLLRRGFDGYLSKPILDEGELLALLERLLGAGGGGERPGAPAPP